MIARDCAIGQRQGWPTPDAPTPTRPEQPLILSKAHGPNHERGVPLSGQPLLVANFLLAFTPAGFAPARHGDLAGSLRARRCWADPSAKRFHVSFSSSFQRLRIDAESFFQADAISFVGRRRLLLASVQKNSDM